MTGRIERRPQVREDLAEIVGNIEQSSPESARRFWLPQRMLSANWHSCRNWQVDLT